MIVDHEISATGSWGFVDIAAGIRLRYLSILSKKQATRGSFIVAQGRGEFIEKYIDVMRALTDRGYNAIAFDWRCQGGSSRLLANPYKGHIDDYACYFDDLDAICATLYPANKRTPIFALAHSMGGHIILRYMTRPESRIQAAIMTSPMIDIARNAAQRTIFRAVAGVAVRAGLANKYVAARGDYGALDRDFGGNRRTHDPERFRFEVEALSAEPSLALGGPTWGWLNATMLSIDRLHEELTRWPPGRSVSIVSAGQDCIVSTPAQISACDGRPGFAMHSIAQAYHEILQETPTVRREFWAIFDSMFQQHVGADNWIASAGIRTN